MEKSSVLLAFVDHLNVANAMRKRHELNSLEVIASDLARFDPFHMD